MNSHRIAAATAALVLAGGATATLTGTSDAATQTHTMTFISITQAHFISPDGVFVAREVDRAGGKVIAYDVLRGTWNPSTNQATIDISVAFGEGTMYLKGTTTDTGSRGRVVGGTGAFLGTTGSFKATNLDEEGTKSRVTLTYTS